MGEDALDHRLGKQIGVALQGGAQPDEAVGLEPLAQRLGGVVEGGEVEVQDDVPVAVRRRPAPDVGAREQAGEAVGAGTIVIVRQQRHPARLAEAARPDQKGVPLLLQVMQKPGLVDVQGALAPYRPEVGPAVGYLRMRVAHRSGAAVRQSPTLQTSNACCRAGTMAPAGMNS